MSVETAEWTGDAAARSLARRVAEWARRLAARDSVVSIVDQATVSGGNFLMSVALGRLASRSELGLYALAASLLFFVRGLQHQLLAAPYLIHCQRRRGRAAALFTGSSFTHQAIFSTVAATLLGLAAVSAAAVGAPRAWLVCMVFLAAPLVLLREHIRDWCFAQLEMRAALWLDASVAMMQLAALGLLALLGWLSAAAVIASLGAACGAASLGWWALRRPPLARRRRLIGLHWKRNWGFARWTLASHMLGCSTPYLMPWVLVACAGEAATGLLAACTSLVGVANTFVIGLSNYLSPRSARAYAEGGVDAMTRVLRANALLLATTLGCFTLAAATFGELAARFVYGEQFVGGGAVVPLLAAAMLANSMSIVIGNGLWAMKRPSANFRADAATLIASLVASLAMATLWGASGAAGAVLLGAVVGLAVRWFALSRVIAEDRRAHGEPAREGEATARVVAKAG